MNPPEPQKIPLNLYKKLHKIIKEGVVVGKNGRNNFHKYDYVTEADVTEAAKQKFIENNILLTARVNGVRETKNPEIVEAVMIFTLVDLDSGEEESYTFSGFGQDKGDKNIYKAYTGAFKYFLMKNLMIGSDADPEHDGETQPKKAKKLTNGDVLKAVNEEFQQAKKDVLQTAKEAINKVVDSSKDSKDNGVKKGPDLWQS